MNALILAAGFGTRMGALSHTIAKPLLPVAGKPVAEHLCGRLFATGRIERITIITNAYYFKQFETWLLRYGNPNVDLINDGATENDNRRGAIADIRLARDHIKPTAPLLITAGDNLYEFDFADLISFQQQAKTDAIIAYHQPNIEKLQQTGVAILDDKDRVVGFQEKPEHPKSEYAVPCMYILTPETLQRIGDYIAEGNNPDAPGHFIAWLHSRAPVHAFRFTTPVHAIGDAKSYEAVRNALE